MSIYVVGDLQGCFETFRRLLEKIDFVPGRDRLWMVGDLVNRGDESLEVLRWMRLHETSVTAVLGNHDVHLLGLAAGVAREKSGDTLQGILESPDRRELVEWMRRRPLYHREGGSVLVHAGLLPKWTLDEAVSRALEVEHLLQSDQWVAFLEHVRGKGKAGKPRAREFERAREALAVLTRLRCCRADGTPEYSFKGSPRVAPRGLTPWFAMPAVRWKVPGVRIFFGHWSTLGFHQDAHVVGLDTGAVWGGELTAFRVDDGTLHRVPARDR